MSSKLLRLAFTLFLITTISSIVNGEASGSASETPSQSAMNTIHIAPPRSPSLFGIDAHRGILSIYAMNPIKFSEYVKIEPHQQEFVSPATQDTQREFATPEIHGNTQKPVTFILYIEEVRPDGSVISVPGANVTGQEGAGNSFKKTIDSNGYVTINGTSGTWSFMASAPGYATYNWSQPITSNCIKDAFLQPEASQNGQLRELDSLLLTEGWHVII